MMQEMKFKHCLIVFYRFVNILLDNYLQCHHISQLMFLCLSYIFAAIFVMFYVGHEFSEATYTLHEAAG